MPLILNLTRQMKSTQKSFCRNVNFKKYKVSHLNFHVCILLNNFCPYDPRILVDKMLFTKVDIYLVSKSRINIMEYFFLF